MLHARPTEKNRKSMRKLIIKFLGLKVEDIGIGLFLMIVLFFATLFLLKLEYLIDLVL
tara:strand:+ start:37 stop:210 length:174 start_codon:yes stop_codon:yes gene_type:complete